MTETKTAKLDMRITPQQKDKIKQVAAAVQESASDFVLKAVDEKINRLRSNPKVAAVLLQATV